METKQFKTTPELERMVRISHQMNEDYKAMLRGKYNSPQNCKVGKSSKLWGEMPALQVRSIFKKESVFLQFRPAEMEQCPGTGLCSPAGRRSRMEWCKCGKVE